MTRPRTIRLCTLDRLLGLCIVVALGIFSWALMAIVDGIKTNANLSARVDALERGPQHSSNLNTEVGR